MSSPLGVRARIGTICRGCELEISGTSRTLLPHTVYESKCQGQLAG